MPIVLAGSMIQLQWVSGDAKGNSSNPWTFDDIVSAGYMTKDNNIYYSTSKSIYISGSSTYFVDANKHVVFTGADNGLSYYFWVDPSGAHVKLGTINVSGITSNGISFFFNATTASNKKFTTQSQYAEYYACIFDGFPDSYGTSGYYGIFDSCIFSNSFSQTIAFGTAGATTLIRNCISLNCYYGKFFNLYTILENFTISSPKNSGFSIVQISGMIFTNVKFVNCPIDITQYNYGNGTITNIWRNCVVDTAKISQPNYNPGGLTADMISNVNLEGVVICKCTDSTNTIIIGAAISVTNKNGTVIASGVSDSNGLFQFNALVYQDSAQRLTANNYAATSVKTNFNPFTITASKSGNVSKVIITTLIYTGDNNVNLTFQPIPASKFFTRVFNLYNLKGNDSNNPVNNAFIQVQNAPEILQGNTDVTGNLVKTSNRKVVFDSELNIAEYYQDDGWHQIHDFVNVPEEVVSVYTPMLPDAEFDVLEQRSFLIVNESGVPQANALLYIEISGYTFLGDTNEFGIATIEIPTTISYVRESNDKSVVMRKTGENPMEPALKVYTPSAVIPESVGIVRKNLPTREINYSDIQHFIVKNAKGEVMPDVNIRVLRGELDNLGVTDQNGSLYIELPFSANYDPESANPEIVIKKDGQIVHTIAEGGIAETFADVGIAAIPPVYVDRKFSGKITNETLLKGSLNNVFTLKGKLKFNE